MSSILLLVIFLINLYVGWALSHVQLFETPWNIYIAHQAPLSMELSRQEYWSGLPFPSLGDLSDPRIKPTSLASPALAGRFFTSWATREAIKLGKGYMNIFSQKSSIQQIFSQQSSHSTNINWMSSMCSTREGNSNPLQYSCLENPMHGGAW